MTDMTKAVTREELLKLAERLYIDCTSKDYRNLEAAITTIIRERDEAVAILAEQNSLLDACGTILCRYQVKHDRFEGCLYCDRDEWKKRAEESENFILEHRIDHVGGCIGCNESLEPSGVCKDDCLVAKIQTRKKAQSINEPID